MKTVLDWEVVWHFCTRIHIANHWIHFENLSFHRWWWSGSHLSQTTSSVGNDRHYLDFKKHLHTNGCSRCCWFSIELLPLGCCCCQHIWPYDECVMCVTELVFTQTHIMCTNTCSFNACHSQCVYVCVVYISFWHELVLMCKCLSLPSLK